MTNNDTPTFNIISIKNITIKDNTRDLHTDSFNINNDAAQAGRVGSGVGSKGRNRGRGKNVPRQAMEPVSRKCRNIDEK